MKIFFDTEFTGLVQDTSLISIGLVAEDGRKLYMELNDYDETKINSWLQENVINKLDNDVKFSRSEVAQKIADFIEPYDEVVMVSDCLAYDWVLFCDLFGGAMGIPGKIHYIPIDLSTMFFGSGIDPDVNREEFAGIAGESKHNALHDALVMQVCFEKLSKE